MRPVLSALNRGEEPAQQLQINYPLFSALPFFADGNTPHFTENFIPSRGCKLSEFFVQNGVGLAVREKKFIEPNIFGTNKNKTNSVSGQVNFHMIRGEHGAD